MVGSFFRFLPQHKQIEPFHPVSGPGGLAQKLEAGLDAWVMGKASNRNTLSKFRPAEIGLQLANNGFKCEAVQRVSRLFVQRHINQLNRPVF